MLPAVPNPDEDLRGPQATWDDLGRKDPLWAVLSYPEMRGGKWDQEAFFASGRSEISGWLERVTALGLDAGRGRCLDFGCGVGRLTQALADHFEVCDGVDIAPSMVGQARALNRHGDHVHYHVNAQPDLRLFPDHTFDAVYCRVVLQHIRPAVSKRYVAEFVRVLKPGGLAYFEVPIGPDPERASQLALPSSAFRARLTLDSVPRRMAPTVATQCRVRVRNAGDTTWPAAFTNMGTGVVQLGNHWRKLSGSPLTFDDGRAPLPRDLAPGDEATVGIRVSRPAGAAAVRLEFDMVQEGVTWFAAHGSPVARRTVLRKPSHAPPPPPRSDEDVPFEMHGVPEETVREAVEHAGGRMLRVEPNGPPEWRAAEYFVTKGGT